MHPVLIELGGHALPAWGVAAVVATLAAVGFGAWRESRPDGVGAERLAELAVVVVGVGLLGAKLPLLVAGPVRDARLLLAGGYFDAGVAAGVAAAWAWAAARGRSFLALADRLIPAAPLAGAVGRIGCLAAGCCHGGPTDLPWGIVYSDPRAQALGGVPLGVPVHPVPLVHAAGQAVLFAALLRWPGEGTRPGARLATWALAEGFLRLALEPLRGDPRGTLGPFPLTAAGALALVASGAVLLVRGKRA